MSDTELARFNRRVKRCQTVEDCQRLMLEELREHARLDYIDRIKARVGQIMNQEDRRNEGESKCQKKRRFLGP